MAGVDLHIEPNSLKVLQKKFNRLGPVAFNICYKNMVRIAMELSNEAKEILKSGGHIVTNRLRASLFVKSPALQIDQKFYSWDGGSGSKDFNVVLTDAEIAYGTNVEYAAALNDGSKPHVIRAKNAKVLSNGKQFFGKQVNHPGTKGVKFMERSIEKYDTISRKYLSRAAKELEAEAAK